MFRSRRRHFRRTFNKRQPGFLAAWIGGRRVQAPDTILCPVPHLVGECARPIARTFGACPRRPEGNDGRGSQRNLPPDDVGIEGKSTGPQLFCAAVGLEAIVCFQFLAGHLLEHDAPNSVQWRKAKSTEPVNGRTKNLEPTLAMGPSWEERTDQKLQLPDTLHS